MVKDMTNTRAPTEPAITHADVLRCPKYTQFGRFSVGKLYS